MHLDNQWQESSDGSQAPHLGRISHGDRRIFRAGQDIAVIIAANSRYVDLRHYPKLKAGLIRYEFDVDKTWLLMPSRRAPRVCCACASVHLRISYTNFTSGGSFVRKSWPI
jgi:hypothetical protein